MRVIEGDDLVIPMTARVISEHDGSCDVKRVTIGGGARVFRRASLSIRGEDLVVRRGVRHSRFEARISWSGQASSRLPVFLSSPSLSSRTR